MTCPNCETDNVKIFHDSVWSIENGRVYQCNECTLTFIHPMMSEKEEYEFYKNFNAHIKARGLATGESLQDYHKKSISIAKERMNVVSNYFHDGIKVLEIGSSTGAFLSLLNNCHTSAVEPSDDNREFSKQFITDRAYSSIEKIQESEKFDVICMFHVFEHIREPSKFLDNCKKLLKDNGIILIEVPHIEDPLISIYDIKEFKDFVFQPMHPMIYSVPSLDYIFSKNGFLSTNVIYYQRYGLSNHLTWLKYKKPGGDKKFDEIFKEDKEYKRSIEFVKKTDTIFYIVKISSKSKEI
ncbi:MAG: class I SAM-dependent methyltransferase [Sulfurimonas sp.]|uniref:class I SAM-dependent methyltransferase n=1 Tax=Sulfurimonas sp. TaxID=2022749 RepID=UPI0026373745|nr:class I SAM-dependent methyltransferase [Sulfurimonas sp.]MDD2652975.1 class I SAM-dependent methyltransferase [Sulfurimonas sp.]MDD3452421.1 class I SAM-dependent methyltransferase [Sulfurimonas sp.]